MPKRKSGLGDIVANALSKVGITEERLSGWLGRPCGCRKRRDKLNKLGEWAKRVLLGEQGTAELAELTEDPTITPTPSAEPPQDA